MDRIEILISADDIRKRVKELGRELSEYYKGKDIYAVCILKGGVIFMVDLLKEIDAPYNMGFMSLSSYGRGTASSGEITVNLDMPEDLTGRNVLFVEDIVDSGRTLDFLLKRAKERNAQDVKVCTLLHKPERMVFDVDIDYVGFDIPDKFVVGYGLDFDQKYRYLKYIGFLPCEQ